MSSNHYSCNNMWMRGKWRRTGFVRRGEAKNRHHVWKRLVHAQQQYIMRTWYRFCHSREKRMWTCRTLSGYQLRRPKLRLARGLPSIP